MGQEGGHCTRLRCGGGAGLAALRVQGLYKLHAQYCHPHGASASLIPSVQWDRSEE